VRPDITGSKARIAPVQSSSISDFIVTAAPDAEHKAAAEAEVIRLSRDAQEQLSAFLLGPPSAPDTLRRAIERHRTLIVDSCVAVNFLTRDSVP
jgi:uncharacterized protein (DUF1778 family)